MTGRTANTIACMLARAGRVARFDLPDRSAA